MPASPLVVALAAPRLGQVGPKADLSTDKQRREAVERVWAGFFSRYQGPAAETIQRWWRGYAARRYVLALRAGRLLKGAPRERVEESAARVIQRRWRGVLARREAAERLKAVIDIQASWRGYWVRKAWPRWRIRMRYEEMQEAATAIQRWVR